jgi:hypothetical protein
MWLVLLGGYGSSGTASNDHSQAVVLKVSKAVGTPLNELHLPMEAFRNAIVFGEPPHRR